MSNYRPTPQLLASLNFKPSAKADTWCAPGSGRRYTAAIHMHYSSAEHAIEVYNGIPAQYYKLASTSDEQFAAEVRLLASAERGTGAQEDKCRLI